ncbi:hypothetical protein ABW20_dc0102520 [Dactylellina cionopaga]|nr:hypothetical protein ABW20_dc0102520 [Dactylellina cionopaga]
MSVAYPNQNPTGPNAESFSASAAFSFDQHNPTQIFGGMNTDPQTQIQAQMPAQSLSVPMVQVSHVEFPSDYDMGNAPRDEDFDIDLDEYDDDGDMNLDDLATPMATVDDDMMDEAANGPQHTLFGQPGPSANPSQNMNLEQTPDEEMVDDTLGQTANEVMLDADHSVPAPTTAYTFPPLPQIQQARAQIQPQQLDQIAEQPQERPSTSLGLPTEIEAGFSGNVENQLDSAVNTAPAQDYRQPAVEKQGNSSDYTPVLESAQQDPPQTSTKQVEEEPRKEATPPAEVPQAAEAPTEPATPPSRHSPNTEASKTPQAKNLDVPKHQTPPSSADALRISQADTVPLENPTPEVNQREWYIAGTPQLEDQEASTNPPILAYSAHQEIPTSPLQGVSVSGSSRPSFHSEHEGQSPKPSSYSDHESQQEETSQPSQHPEEQANPESTTQSAKEEEQNDASNEDSLLTHPVVVVYRGLEFSLFPVLEKHPKLPETSFLPDRIHVGSPLSKLVASLRDVLGEEFTASEEIVLNFTALGVEFEEENIQMNQFTLYDLIGLFSKLVSQDGIDEIQPLCISLTSRKKYIPKLELIHSHILGGGGLNSWKHALVGLGNNQPVSEPHSEEGRSQHANLLGNLEKETHDDGHTVKSPEPSRVDHSELDHDEELELEEFEKDFEGENAYYALEAHQAEPQLEAKNNISSIDVPKSPSQASIERSKPSLAHENSNTEGSINVPETQYSQDIEHATPTNEQHPVISGQTIDNSLSKDDEASFVTAQEKQNDTSVVQSYTVSRSYGLPETPGTNEEQEIGNEEPGKGIENHAHDNKNVSDAESHLKNPDAHHYQLLTTIDDDFLDFDDPDHDVPGDENDALPEEETKSSSTLHEGSESDVGDRNVPQDQEDGENDANPTNWNDWTYEGDEAANEQRSLQDENEEHSVTYLETTHEGAANQIGQPELTSEDLDLDPNEFAYYPLAFSPYAKQNRSDEQDDESLFGLDQHETHSATTSTAKRGREDDDEEEEVSEGEDSRSSPTPASKKHKVV